MARIIPYILTDYYRHCSIFPNAESHEIRTRIHISQPARKTAISRPPLQFLSALMKPSAWWRTLDVVKKCWGCVKRQIGNAVLGASVVYA